MKIRKMKYEVVNLEKQIYIKGNCPYFLPEQKSPLDISNRSFLLPTHEIN